MKIKEGKTRDLTKGSIVMPVLLVALPILLGQFMQTLYNSVDSMVVGNYLGKTALAAVSSCMEPSQMIIKFFTGLSVGAGVMFSRCFGSGDYKRLRRAIHTAIPAAFVLGVILSAAGSLMTPVLLHLLRCPDNVYPEAAIYLRIYMSGVFITACYNVITGILRATGDTATPFYYLAVSCILNIVLDLFFVVCLELGVAGVAVATILAQLTSAVLIVRKMMRTQEIYQFCIREICIDFKMLGEIIALGVPSGLQNCLVTLSNAFIQGYINSFEASAIAGIGIAKKVDAVITDLSQSVALANSTFVAQNVGAGNYKRAMKGTYRMLAVGIAGVMSISLAVYMGAPKLLSLFSKETEVLQYGVDFMRTIIPCYWFLCISQLFYNANRAFGRSMESMFTTLAGMVGCKQLFLAVTMTLNWNIRNIYYSYPTGWFFGGLFNVTLFFCAVRPEYTGKKKK